MLRGSGFRVPESGFRIRLVTLTAALLLIGGAAAPASAAGFKVGSFTKSTSQGVTVQTSSEVSAKNTTSFTITSFNPGTGTNRVLVVGLSFDITNSVVPSNIGVTFGGVALTQIAGTAATRPTAHTEMWYLVNPSSTPANIVASWTGTFEGAMGAVVFNGADQTTPVRNGASATGTSTAISTTITSASGDMTMDTVITESTTNPWLSSPTQTQQWRDTSNNLVGGAGGSTASGAASVTHAWTAGSAADWAASGVDIKAANPPTQAIAHGLGQVPKALMLWTEAKTSSGSFSANYQVAFGVTDGTTSKSAAGSSQNGVGTSAVERRMANKILSIVDWTGTTNAEADFVSWDATNFTVTWSTNDTNADVIHFLAIGGSDVSAKVVGWTMPTAAGNKSVTGVGFQPTAVIHAYLGAAFTSTPPATQTNDGFGLGAMDFGGHQWANGYFSASGISPTTTHRAQTTGACIQTINNAQVTKSAAWVSMDADGFTVNFTTANNQASQVFSLALGGVNAWVGNFLKTTAAAPASQSITGLGFQPAAVLFTSFQDTAQGGIDVNSRFGLGASDGTTEGSIAHEDLNNVATTSAQAIDKTTKAFVKVDNATPAVDAEADLTSMDANGFTLNWTTNDAVQTQILYLGLANLVNTEVRLVSFEATRYARGTLLQWRTGYEFNNLGFNLYREINGTRTRVNTSLVAGSGLLAGRGTAVNAVETYARWDLDQAAGADGVSYWLEDLDFNGTSTLHGPITPVAGALNAPEPTVTPASDLADLSSPTGGKVLIRHNEDLNPITWRMRRPASRAAQNALAAQWALAAQAPLKIGIRHPGWYRIPRSALVAAGLDPHVDPHTLRLFVDGTPVAMRVSGADGARRPGGAGRPGGAVGFDAIEFYATGVDTPYTDTRVYWLAAGGNQTGERVPVRSDAASVGGSRVSGPGTSAAPASFWSTLERKDRRIYFAALENGEAENWFGPLVSPNAADLMLAIDHVDPAAPAPARLEVVLQGVTIQTHQVTVLVNGTQVGVMTFDSQANASQTFAVPAHVLIDGDNDVTLTAQNGDADYSLVDRLRLSYWHLYEADADQLRCTVATPRLLTIRGFASAAIRVVDITDPAAAIELRGVVRPAGSGGPGGSGGSGKSGGSGRPGGGFFDVTVRVGGTGPRTLLAFSEPTIAAPAWVRANHRSSWHASSPGHDYVVLSHADFVDVVQPLADHRKAQGYHPAVIDVDDLYDEFSFGEKTPQAIKDFLQWARTAWTRAPRFVVLVGDATIDPRDYAGLGHADFVPTRQVAMQALKLKTASDDWFVDFDGVGLPALPIGRLSVRTANQAEAVVSKIVGYDHSSLQPWTKEILLVAEQDDDTSSFARDSDRLKALLPAEYHAQEIFVVALGSDAAHQTLVTDVNAGQLLVNYAGHGSVQLWGNDGTLLNNDDIAASWRTGLRLPFVVAMNCLNGLFDQIWDEESLAEALQRAPGNGAVAVWASSSVTPEATQALVNQELFRLIFGGTYATLGEVVAAAKRVVTNPDLRKSWIFFGDPAMQLLGVPGPASVHQSIAPPASGLPPAGSPAVSPAHAQPGAIRAALAARPDPVRLVDFNADGRADVWVYAEETGRWSAAFSRPGSLTLQQGLWEPGWEVLAADLNGDGRADLFFYRLDTSAWAQALSNPDGTFRVTSGTMPDLLPHVQVRAGDFNGDGRDDLLVYDPDTGAWVVALADGRGGFAFSRGVWLPGLRIHVADVNGDGLADVFGYDASSGAGMLALVDVPHVSAGSVRFTVSDTNWGPGWQVVVGHFGPGGAGRGQIDFLFYDPTSGSWMEALRGAGGTVRTYRGTWPLGMELHATDLDGDGRDDVFGYSPMTGEWMAAVSAGPGQFATVGGTWSAGWLVATGDLNGDGRGDVFLYDAWSGAWVQCVTVRPGVFAYRSGTWTAAGAFIGKSR